MTTPPMTTPPLTTPPLTVPAASAPLPDRGLRLVKGHGTENDFLILLDADDRLGRLQPGMVAELCDRRRGLGADGLIRAVRGGDEPSGDDGAGWSMDYYNSDGSTGLMCGNGIRVLAEVLLRDGLIGPGPVDIATSSGPRRVQLRRSGVWAVDMGVVRVGVPDGSELDAAPGDSAVDTLVVATGLGEVPRPGMSVDVGNPHIVVAVTGPDELTLLDLRQPPRLLPRPDEGANVEFVAVLGVDADTGTGRLAMRVHERGCGETRSCGTGAVAAAAAAVVWAGGTAPRQWSADVPGGRLTVELAGGRATLVGPAVIVADLTLEPAWVDRWRRDTGAQVASLTRSNR